jgi:hypothetical protein
MLDARSSPGSKQRLDRRDEAFRDLADRSRLVMRHPSRRVVDALTRPLRRAGFTSKVDVEFAGSHELLAERRPDAAVRLSVPSRSLRAAHAAYNIA